MLRVPVTSAALSMSIVVSLIWWVNKGQGDSGIIDLFVMDIRAWHGQPWRLITSALPHVNVFHLVFNVQAVWVLGSFAEREFGSRETFAMMIVMAAVSAAAEYAIFAGGVGLSGIGYGLFGLVWVLDRRHPDYRGRINKRLVTMFVGWFFLCLVLTALNVWRIANVAHAAGAIIGAIIGLVISERQARRWLAVGLLAITAMLCYLGATTFRPHINQGGYEAELAYRAYLELQAGRNENALRMYNEALQRDGGQAESWQNRGVVLERLGRLEEAVADYQQAARLMPDVERYRVHAAGMTARLAFLKQEAGKHAEAAMLYKEAVSIDDRHALHWFNLGVALQQSGQVEAARDAYQQAAERAPKNQKYRAALESLP